MGSGTPKLVNMLMCWEGCMPERVWKPWHASSPYLNRYISSIWRFLIIKLYHKQSTFPSSVSHPRKLLDLGGHRGSPQIYNWLGRNMGSLEKPFVAGA